MPIVDPFESSSSGIIDPFEPTSSAVSQSPKEPDAPEWAGKYPNIYGLLGAAKSVLSAGTRSRVRHSDLSAWLREP